MAIDYAETIKYIQDNLDKVKLSPSELEALQSTLRLIKVNVEHQIIEEAVRNSSELKGQLENEKSYVKYKIARIKSDITRKQSELNYTPSHIPENVPESIIEEVERGKKSEYNKQIRPAVEAELQRLQKRLDFYEGVSPYINNPELFIEQFLKNKFSDRQHDEELQRLIDLCATNMAHGYLEMETSRVSDKPSGVKSPIIRGENPLAFGEPLFTHTPGSNFSGYKINPEGLSQFFELIRDEDLVEELTTYDEAFMKVRDRERKLESDRKTLANLEESKRLLQDWNMYSQFETMITDAADLEEQQSAITEELQQLRLPANSNIFMRWWGIISGSSKRNEEKSTQLEAQSRELTSKYIELRDKYTARIAEDPKFKELSGLYIYAITEHKPGEGFYEPGLEPDSDFFDLAHGVIHYRESKNHGDGKSLNMYVTEKSKIDSKIFNLSGDIALSETILEQDTRKKEELYKTLSPKAKELTDKSPRGAVSMYEIKQRYIDNNSRTRYGVSPFISALILEAIFKMHDIKTPEDADKLGIEFGIFDTARMKDNSIAAAIQAVKNMITPQEERE